MTVETITQDELLRRCEAQGVEPRHYAFKCPMCGTVQSAESLIRAGVAEQDVDKYLAFSCVGRFTGAGPHKKGARPGRGCNWTLGGFLQIHKLIVELPNGYQRKSFEIALPKEAQALRAKHFARAAHA
jgi:hypothetical protein